MPPLCKGRWILPKAKDGGIVNFTETRQSPSLAFGETAPFTQGGLILFVQQLLSLVGLRLVADGADLRLRRAVFGVVAEKVYVPFNVAALPLHGEQDFERCIGVIYGAVGVHAVNACADSPAGPCRSP